MTGRRDAALLAAVGASLALAATAAWMPSAPWRAPLAILGGVWAPGYALVAVAYPRGRLTLLERHGLSACAGLCLLPLLALLSSETIGLSPARVALVALAGTAALALAAAYRGRDATGEPLLRGSLPSTRVTLAACAAALVLAGAVETTTHLTSKPEPASLALSSASGGPLPLRPALGETVAIVVVARAGAQAAGGELAARWDNGTLLARPLSLDAGQALSIDLVLPTDVRGAHRLQVTWRGLETEATFHVGSAR